MIKTAMSAAEAPTATTTATATVTPEAGPAAVVEGERSVAHEASDAERVPEHIEQLAVEIGVREAGSAGVRCEVYRGAHYDSVPAGPGANDNASGTASLLEVERVHRADRVCVVAFGAEEIGLFGSRTFVDEHDASGARLMLNFDMAGRLDGPIIVGDAVLTREIPAALAAGEFPIEAEEFLPFASSDHGSFSDAGVSAVTITSGDDAAIHTSEDDLARISLEVLATMLEIVDVVLEELAVWELTAVR